MSFLGDPFGAVGTGYFGVTVGVVTNNKDPQQLGRVKLKLPERLGDIETDWARIAVMMAGKEMGSFVLPEVGDEVLVAFREGDIREPFVLGSLWNENAKPPENNSDGKNDLRKFKSRSGHQITINDSEDKGSVEIKTKNGSLFSIDDKDSGVLTLKDKTGNNKTVIDGNNNSIEIKGNMKVTIAVGGNTVTIDGSQNSVEIKSDLKLSLKAQMVEIKAGASMDINCDGMINIKGAMVKIN